MLRTTLRLLGSAFGTLFGVSFFAMLPFALFLAVRMAGDAAQEQLASSDERLGESLAFGLIAGVCLSVLLLVWSSAVGQGATSYAVVQLLGGRRVTALQSLRAASRRTLPLVHAMFWTGLALSLGSFCCVIPGVYAQAVLGAALPAVTVERLGALGAMRRSAALSRGQRGEIVAIWLAVAVILFAGILVLAVPSLLSGRTLHDDVDPRSAEALWGLLETWVSYIGMTLLYDVVSAVIYIRLREARDGANVRALADVFA